MTSVCLRERRRVFRRPAGLLLIVAVMASTCAGSAGRFRDSTSRPQDLGPIIQAPAVGWGQSHGRHSQGVSPAVSPAQKNLNTEPQLRSPEHTVPQLNKNLSKGDSKTMLKGEDGPDAENLHAGLKVEPQAVIDSFVIIYWSCVIVLVAAAWIFLKKLHVDKKLLAEAGSYHDAFGGTAWKWHSLQRSTTGVAEGGAVEFCASVAECDTDNPLINCNGNYTWCGQYNGRSKYRNAHNAIVFFDDEWKMSNCDDTSFSCFSSGDTTGWEPPSTTWAGVNENESVTITDSKLSDVKLPENMWALCLIAALGQAELPGSRAKAKRYLQASTVAAISIFMASLQVFGLFLVVHDIDPNSDPITTKPSSPYGSVISVNTIKVIMTLLLVMALVSEAGQCKAVFQAGMEVHASRLRSSRWLPLAMISIQYVVGLLVVWAGCCAILSFQSVPDIIYSSMAITCISNVDEFFYEAWAEVAALEASFRVTKKTMPDNVEIAPRDRKHVVHELPFVYHFFAKLGLFFPMIWGLAIFGRAWYSGHMPCERVTIFTSRVVSWFMH